MGIVQRRWAAKKDPDCSRARLFQLHAEAGWLLSRGQNSPEQVRRTIDFDFEVHPSLFILRCVKGH